MNYEDKITAAIKRIQVAAHIADRHGEPRTEDNKIPVNPCYDFGRRVGCMVCPYAPQKQLIAVFNEFPNLKRKMLQAIHGLRSKGLYAIDYPDKTDEEILEWWMSKKNIR